MIPVMIRNTITLKILSFVVCAFLLTGLSVFMISSNQLEKIIDYSQNAVYEEKLENILRTLKRQVERLKKTELREAYEEDFQDSVLRALRQTYYRSEDQQIYPFIVNTARQVVMHPKFSRGDMSLSSTKYMKKATDLKNGEFRYTYKTGEAKWTIFKNFEEWEWIVGYAVPLDVKYADLQRFRNSLIIIMIVIILFIGLGLTVIINRIMRPIKKLTAISTEIAAGNLDQEIDTKGKDELGVLARSFAHMRDSIKKQIIELKTENAERKRAEQALKRAHDELEQRVAERTSQLATANKELESFSYSVSHDLRAPLRSMDGFSLALLEDYADKLDESGKDYLRRVRAGCERMGSLIDDLLQLSRLTRGVMRRETVNLSAMAESIAKELQQADPERQVQFAITPEVIANGDSALLQVVIDNLLGNAWKFTGKAQDARIEFGVFQDKGPPVYFVKDSGVGFDMAYADKLFGTFQRLHKSTEFEGSGIGLATVQRIIHRHGGRVWAEGVVDNGATFYFTLP